MPPFQAALNCPRQHKERSQNYPDIERQAKQRQVLAMSRPGYEIYDKKRCEDTDRPDRSSLGSLACLIETRPFTGRYQLLWHKSIL